VVNHGHLRARHGAADLHQARLAGFLAAAEGTRLEAYVPPSLLAGIRTEEARALRWDHVVVWVDDEVGRMPIAEVGFDGVAVAPGELWQENGLLFASRVGHRPVGEQRDQSVQAYHQEGRGRQGLGAA